ncbi:MAG TPA: hypothetical protein VFF03_18855 [Rhodocyclaceae bacterium]|nr:hypothetical protein [Rhodocyclaceae bacterium]
MRQPPLSREALAKIRCYDDFFNYCRTICRIEESDLFAFLFPIAISERGDGANVMAGFALMELEPRCPLSCSEAIEAISSSRWDVSTKGVPFYLISQFGKWQLAHEISAFLERPYVVPTQKKYVESIWYWASGPSAKLAGDLTYWEWQEVIERPNV